MKPISKMTLGAGLILLAMGVGFVWKEGKKETQFLCANFQKGDSKTSIISQLDTANLAYYDLLLFPQGQRILFQPFIGLAPRCIIDFDDHEKVTRAQLQ